MRSTVTGTKGAKSGVNEQPVGLEETMRGARNRAEAARAIDSEADLWVGIESGVVRVDGVSLDLAVVAILLPDGTFVYSTTTGIVFPEELVEIAESIGFEAQTVGALIAEPLGGDGTDPHTTLTGGRLSRAKTLVDGVVAALVQIPSLFPAT